MAISQHPLIRGESTTSRPPEPPTPSRRLLSPGEAALYLGLRSRFAIYRLVASRQLQALRVANKLRLDLCDLNSFIESAKADSGPAGLRQSTGRTRLAPVPRQLRPFKRRRRAVTSRVTPEATEP
jgi:excisionase family DNA binding protein